MASLELRTYALLGVLLVCSRLLCTVSEAEATVEEREIQVLVNTNKVVNVIDDDTFLCVTFDWWPSAKCSNGSCPWGQTSLLNLDLNNPILTRALQALTPVTLRAGGTLQNLVVYDIGEQIASEACRPFVYNESALYQFSGGCLSMQRWDALNAFWTKAGYAFIRYNHASAPLDWHVKPWFTEEEYVVI